MGAVKDEVYKCDVCGNVVKVLNGGDGDLVCCGEDMKLLTSAEAKAFA
jgi:superoxide reductase